MQEQCLICKSLSDFSRVGTEDALMVSCPKCGKHRFTGTAWATLQHRSETLTDRQRANISGWLYNNPAYKVSSDEIDWLTTIKAPGFHERSDNLLLIIKKDTEYAGQYVEEKPYWYSCAWCSNKTELNELRDYLQREQRIITEGSKFKIQPNGWAHLEQLETEIELSKSEVEKDRAQGIEGKVSSNKVFIVHGHNQGIKETVARFIEKIGLEAVILHEKPNKGRTIIEKFSDYSDVHFAIVLLTGDDIGKEKESPKGDELRARQNVIFEFGYFIGKLGRSRVCALYEEGVEIPSDYQGVIFVPLDGRERWKHDVVKELLAAGFNVDANKIFGADSV